LGQRREGSACVKRKKPESPEEYWLNQWLA